MNDGSPTVPQRFSHRRQERGARRRRIFEAAEAVFSARGYHDASVTEIAVRADLAAGTIYLYFRDKADLYGSVVLEKMNEVVGRLETALTSRSPRSRVFALRCWHSLRITMPTAHFSNFFCISIKWRHLR